MTSLRYHKLEIAAASRPLTGTALLGKGDVDPDLLKLHQSTSRAVGSIGVYIIPNAEVFGDIFVTQDGQLVDFPDVLPQYIAAQIQVDQTIDLLKQYACRSHKVLVNGPVALINSTAHRVYGHWLLDIWSRFWILKTLFGSLGYIPRCLIASTSPSYGPEILSRVFGFPAENLIYYDTERDILQTELLFLPSLPHEDYVFHPIFKDYVDFILAKAEANRVSCRKLIYISRRKYREQSESVQRSIVNESEVESILGGLGFITVYPEDHDFLDQVLVFRGATFVIGEAGSGLHNTIFCRPNTVILSLGHINQVQSSLAHLFNHHLYILKGLLTSEGSFFSPEIIKGLVTRYVRHGLE